MVMENDKSETTNKEWGLQQLWNESVLMRQQRPVEPRNRLWASELGGSYIDTYLKLKGVAPTNPFNERSLRKFEAGNFWEWAVGMILKRAGVLKDSQKYITYQLPGMLEVTGRLDFRAGGAIDWNEAERNIASLKNDLELPEFLYRVGERIVNEWSQKYPNGLNEYIFEIKSASSFMFDTYEVAGADPKHVLQAYHYMLGTGLDEARIFYICKDDVRTMEFAVKRNEETEARYKEFVTKMTHYLANNIMPEKENPIEFIEDRGKFASNWKVAYSPYLTYLYGFEDQLAFDNEYKKKTEQWNRVLKRIVDGAKMTPLNLSVINEIKFSFPNFDELIEKAKAVGVTDDEEVIDNGE